jgi:CobQ-like glutamine amidotransferase family enzyme
MDVDDIHFYPDLMNLYGSYANVSAVQRLLERRATA